MQIGEDIFGGELFANAADAQGDPVSWYEICPGVNQWAIIPALEGELVRCTNGS